MTEPEELATGEAVALTPPTVSENAADGDSNPNINAPTAGKYLWYR